MATPSDAKKSKIVPPPVARALKDPTAANHVALTGEPVAKLTKLDPKSVTPPADILIHMADESEEPPPPKSPVRGIESQAATAKVSSQQALIEQIQMRFNDERIAVEHIPQEGSRGSIRLSAPAGVKIDLTKLGLAQDAVKPEYAEMAWKVPAKLLQSALHAEWRKDTTNILKIPKTLLHVIRQAVIDDEGTKREMHRPGFETATVRNDGNGYVFIDGIDPGTQQSVLIDEKSEKNAALGKIEEIGSGAQTVTIPVRDLLKVFEKSGKTGGVSARA